MKAGGGKRALLRAIVASLTATALLAIGILLFGHFGQTEGRILITTILLAGYGLLALPAGFLFDQGRLPVLASTVLGLAAAAFAVNVALVWTGDTPPEELAKTLATLSAFAVAATQIAALAARRRERDPTSVRRLFRVSSALVLVLALMGTVAAWTEIKAGGFYRVLAAGAVLDLLLVVLQPILGLTRPAAVAHRLRILDERGEEILTTVEAPDFAAAAAKAIHAAERRGSRVLGVSRADSGPRDVGRPSHAPAEYPLARLCDAQSPRRRTTRSTASES